MDSVEKLISLVQAQPCLYNRSHKHYRNTAQKELVWQKISQELKQSCDTSKNKWKNLKDGYTKYKKQKKCGAGKKRPYAKWIWGPYLKFLDPYTKKSSDGEEEGDASPSSHFEDDELSSSPATPKTCEVMLPAPAVQNSRIWTSDEQQEPMHQILDYIKNERKIDASDHLFASYAKTFRKLKPRTQHSVKLQLAQIFADAELKDMDSDNLDLSMLSPGCVKNSPTDK